MKTLNRQKLDVVNKTRSNIFGWRGQFTPDSSLREASEKAFASPKGRRPRLRVQPSQWWPESSPNSIPSTQPRVGPQCGATLGHRPVHFINSEGVVSKSIPMVGDRTSPRYARSSQPRQG